MKRFLSILLAVAMIITSMTVVSFAGSEATATMESKTVMQGDTFDVIISLSNCSSIKSFQLSNFNFGDNFILNKATPLVEGADISKWNNGKLTVAFAENVEYNGEALKLNLTAANTATVGETSITFDAVFKEYNQTTDEDENLPSLSVAGVINITEKPVIKATATMESKTVKLGETVDVIISLTNCTSVKSFQLSNFNFGDNLTLVEAKPLVEGADIAKWNNGKLTVAFAENVECNGDALKLTLKASDAETAVGEATVTFDALFKEYNASTDEDENLPSLAVAGVINIIAEQVTLDWPAEDIAEDIVYGQTLADAFVGFPKAGKVNIDGVDYDGQFEVVAPETIPPAGKYEAKLVFKATVNGKERTFDGPGYFYVTVNKAAFNGTIEAKPATVVYTGSAAAYNTNENITISANNVAVKDVVYSPENPEDVGEYEVTISFTSTDANIADPADVKTTLIIEKAEATVTSELEAVKSAKELAEAGITDLAGLAATLPSTLDVEFAAGIDKLINVTWTAKEDNWNVKGGTNYEFTPVFESKNFEVADFSYIVGAPAVEGALDTSAFKTITISKDQAQNAESLVALGFPVEAVLTINGETAAEAVTLAWDNDLAAIKAAAETVTEEDDAEVIFAVSEDIFEDWLTISVSTTIKVIITNKIPATLEPITANDGVYGEEIDSIVEPNWVATDGGNDADATIKITYVGTDGTDYEESEVKPTNAGKYKAIATLVSAIYSANASEAEFEIAPRKVTYTVEANEKAYLAELPDFTGDVTEGEVLEGDDLGITFECVVEEEAAGKTYDIIAAASNKNYDVEVVAGTLTIVKADLPTAAPVIAGDAVVGAELEADTPEIKGDKTGVEIQWFVAGELVATGVVYEVKIADSNKEIKACAVATDAVNYVGETDASEAKVVAKYEIAGDLAVEANPAEIKKDTVLKADVKGIAGSDIIPLAYQWYLGENAIEGATEDTYTIKEGDAGVISLTVVPATEDYVGSISTVVGEIGKTLLDGSVVLTADSDEIAVGTIIKAEVLTNVAAENYDLVWLVNGEAVEVEGAEYELTSEDYGKVISAKIVAKGDLYTGEIVSEDEILFEAIAPTNIDIETATTSNSVTVTLTADANGEELYFELGIKAADAEEELENVTVEADEDGKYVYTFGNLSAGKYIIGAIACNEAGEGEAAIAEVEIYEETSSRPSNDKKPSNNNAGGGGATEVKPEDTTTDASVSVESKTETAVVPSKDLAGKDTVSATVTTDGGNKVEVVVDIKDKAVDSLKVTAEATETEVTGKAAEGIIGEVIEVKVEAKSGKDEVEVGATITVKADAPAYAYAVDELGNTIRLESVYDAETGEVVVANVADGTVVAVSTNAPVDFADVEGRWSKAEVQRAADRGIVNGRGEGYAPEALLTRSETNKLKQNLAEVLKLVLPVNEEVKIDTDPSHWAYASDLWAAQTGITTGTGVNEDGEVVISGEDNVIRQDYITLIARMIKLAIGDVKVEGEAIAFADAADIADYAADAFGLLSSVGILKGSESENGIAANPKANITREEAAALSNRAYDFVKSVKIAK